MVNPGTPQVTSTGTLLTQPPSWTQPFPMGSVPHRPHQGGGGPPGPHGNGGYGGGGPGPNGHCNGGGGPPNPNPHGGSHFTGGNTGSPLYAMTPYSATSGWSQADIFQKSIKPSVDDYNELKYDRQ